MLFRKLNRFFILLCVFSFLYVLIFPPLSLATTAVNSQPSLAEVSDRLTYWANQYNIPPILLKAIAWQESNWRQVDASGKPLISSNGNGIGIMQISGSDYALHNLSQEEYRNKLMNDFDFNISEGARILSQKWRIAPKIGDGDRNKLENWYLAVWAYNGWDNKNNPYYAKTHGTIPYQDKVMSLVNQKYNSTISLTSPVTLPDSSLFPQAPLDQSFAPATWAPSFLSNWKTPEPFHTGDLEINTDRLLTTGGTTIEQANGLYWDNQDPNQALYALSFYVTGYNSTIGNSNINTQFKGKLEKTSTTIYSYAMSKLLSPKNTLDLYSAKKLLTSIIQLPGISTDLRQKAEIGLSQINTKITKRLSGLTREDTAIAIAKEGWPQGSDTVVLVNSSDQSWADSVAAVPLAVQKSAPVLLTQAAFLPANVLDEIKDLHPRNIILLGGTGVISAQIEQKLKASYQVTRLGGQDRYSTAIQVAQEVGLSSGAVLVNGYAAPDAISVASLAGNAGQPIIYTDSNALPKVTSDFIKNNSLKQLNIVGGTAVIPNAILPKTTNNTRYGGFDRFDTMLQLLKGYNPPINNIFFAYGAGDSFADGLAGGPLVSHLGGILLYADHKSLDSKVITFLKQIRGYAMLDKKGGQIYEFGGSAILNIDDALNSALIIVQN